MLGVEALIVKIYLFAPFLKAPGVGLGLLLATVTILILCISLSVPTSEMFEYNGPNSFVEDSSSIDEQIGKLMPLLFFYWNIVLKFDVVVERLKSRSAT